MIKIFSIFLDTRPFFEKNVFLPLEKLKTLSKFAKNEVKAVKVAVSAALQDVSASRCDMSTAQHDVSAAPCDMLATQDTNGNSRGWEGVNYT